MRIYVYVCICVCLWCVHIYVYMWGVHVCEVYGHVCIHAYVCTYMWCVYASVYVYLGLYVWDACVQCVCGVYGYMCICLCVGFPTSSAGKESACSGGDLGSNPGLGRSPGDGKRHPLQYSDLENPMDYIVHGVTKSQTQLSDFRFLVYMCASVCVHMCVVCV